MSKKSTKITTRERLLRQLEKLLPAERFHHSLNVEKTAVKLARLYGVSTKKASLAALLHDYGRRFSPNQLAKEARRLGLKIDPIQKLEPKLLHAEVGARLVASELGLEDKAILQAIKKHTLGSPAMNKLEQIIYLADHIEEGRLFRGVKKIRRLAQSNLAEAMLAATSQLLGFLLEQKRPIHPATVETRNYYLKYSLKGNQS